MTPSRSTRENPGPWADRISELSTLMDVPVNLDAFAAKGGKLLLAHGTVDVLVSTRATEEYYQRLQARMGPAEVDSSPATTKCRAMATRSARTSTRPGIRSRRSRTGPKEEPFRSTQIVTDTAGVPGRTRPLCDFPRWAQYNGAGDLNLAASFTCVEHETVLPTQRQTHLGPILGNDYSATSGTYAWKGIPFAKAPVGDLRWKPPAEPAAWTTARTAQQFGNACASFGRLYGPGLNNKYDATIGTTLGQPVGSEDCLYLNIWRPATPPRNLPVIVFVYGGSNVTGYTADPVYDGANLAKTANAVVVTVNYRLSLFGFFNLAQLKTGEPLNDSGNFALLDLIKGAAVHQPEHHQFWRQPRQRHGDGPVGGRGQCLRADDIAAGRERQPGAGASLRAHQRRHRAGRRGAAGSFATRRRRRPSAARPTSCSPTWSIGDGPAADLTAATAYIASQTPEQIATYLRSKSADDDLSTRSSTKLAPVGAGGLRSHPRRHRAAHEPDRRHQRRPVREGSGAGGQHTRRRQAVPDAVPAGGWHRQRPR